MTRPDITNIIYEIDGEVMKLCDRTDIGGRLRNEDSHIFESINVNKLGGKIVLAGVFDGHGGSEVSSILEKEIGSFIEIELNKHLISTKPSIVSEILVQTIIKFDESLRTRNVTAGSTLTMVLITEQYIFTVNLGDSRTVIYKPGVSKNRIIFATKDHKPTDLLEVIRIQNAGGRIITLDIPRVNGNLSLSRAIGDFSEVDKPLGRLYSISNVADSHYIERTQPFNILLACDGVWDVFSNEDAINIPCSTLIQESIKRGSRDNLTVVLIKT